MAFLKSNFRKGQFIARARLTCQLDSGAGYITVSIGQQGYPAPENVADMQVNIYPVGATSFKPQLMSPGSLSGNYVALSIFYSGTSASLAATTSIITVIQWIIGSR